MEILLARGVTGWPVGITFGGLTYQERTHDIPF